MTAIAKRDYRNDQVRSIFSVIPAWLANMFVVTRDYKLNKLTQQNKFDSHSIVEYRDEYGRILFQDGVGC